MFPPAWPSRAAARLGTPFRRRSNQTALSPRRTDVIPSRAVHASLAVVAVVAVVVAFGLHAGALSNADDAVVLNTATRDQRPNIVVVMADDMRADDLRYAPSVRKLMARSGLTFENSFSPFPLCCPARASFLTGMYAHNHGIYWHEAPYAYQAFDDSRTIATSLKKAGYATGFIGKYLNRYGLGRSKVSGRPSYQYVPHGWTDWRASFQNPRVGGIHGDTYNYFDTPYNVNGRTDNRYRGRYQTDVIGDFSVEMASRFGRGAKPFFMYVNYVAPHFGGGAERDDPPREGVRGADGVRRTFMTPARPNWVKGKFDAVITRGAGVPRGGGATEEDMRDKPHGMRVADVNAQERAALRTVTRQRAEAIFVMDRQVKRLVTHLKKIGEWDNTIFVFTSDNGYFLGEHRLRTGKVRTYEPSLRVPLLVTGPGIRQGERRYDPITTVDLTATLLEAGQARAPHSSDGISRLAEMTGPDRGWSTAVLTEFFFPGSNAKRTADFIDERTSIGVRTGRYALFRSRGFEELYDLRADPFQDHSVAKDPAYASVRRQLREVWREVKDCSGSSCDVVLPPDLALSVPQLRAQTRRWWRAVDRRYGFGK